jgi:hypothetical protein
VDEGRCSRLIIRPLTKLRAAETLSLPGRRVGMTAYQELSVGTAIAEQFATLHGPEGPTARKRTVRNVNKDDIPSI